MLPTFGHGPFSLVGLVAGSLAALAPSAPPTLEPLGGGSTWRIEGVQAGAHLGSSLATCDVNGDGYGDIVVGAPGFDDLWRDEGRVTVYLGSSGGLSTTPSWTRYGRQPGSHFGATVAAAGDVNGDGYDDVLITAPDFDRLAVPAKDFFVDGFDAHERHSTDEGRVQLYLGSASGLTNLPQRSVTGIERGEHFGTAGAGPGDVNGDGYDDVLVGATGKQKGLGGIFLFAGSSGGMSPLPGWIQLGTEIGAGWGSMLSGAGDVNADGFADFVSSSPRASTCFQETLFEGSALGPGPSQAVNESVAAFGPIRDFDQDGSLEQLFITGACPTPAFRWSRLGGIGGGSLPILGQPAAVTAGDLNGDGRVDMVASSPAFQNGPLQGRVFVYMNRPGSTFTPEASFPVFDGDQAGAGWGEALAAIDVDGDGADELFVAAPRQAAGAAQEGIVELFPGWTQDLTLAPTPYSPLMRNDFVEVAATGDFDADGFSDLVSQLGYAGELRVRYGSSTGLPAAYDGTLQPPTLASHNALFVGTSTGDVNGDGFEDLQVTYNAHFWGHGAYVVDAIRHTLYTGSASGLTTNPVWTIDGGAGEAELVGDVNGDGFDDLYVVRNYGSDQLFLGSSAGLPSTAFQSFPQAYTAESSDIFGNSSYYRHRAVLPGNLDGDSYGDVLVVRFVQSTYEPYIDVYRGSAAGLVLQESLDVATPLGYPAYWAMNVLDWKDIDGDGFDDLVIEGDGTFVFAGSLAGFTRSPQWWEPVFPPGGSTAFWNNHVLAILDADRDGFQDLLLEGKRLHRGSPAGISRTPSWFGSADFPVQLLRPAADFDGDGRPELLSPSQTYPTYGLLIYETGS